MAPVSSKNKEIMFTEEIGILIRMFDNLVIGKTETGKSSKEKKKHTQNWFHISSFKIRRSRFLSFLVS